MYPPLVPASRGRWLLSLYLDFLVFSVPWGFVHLFILERSPEWQKISTPVKFIAFSILELVLHKFIQWSPGKWLLSIRGNEIDPEIKARENAFTLFVAVVVLLEGTKGLVRWAMSTPPSPMFGSVLTAEAWPFVAMTFGAIECVIAYLLFRTRPIALAIAVPYYLFILVSVIMSWDLWDAWTAESVRRRRAFQGIPVREGEIAQMQALTPGIVIGGVAFYLVMVTIAGIILWRRSSIRRNA